MSNSLNFVYFDASNLQTIPKFVAIEKDLISKKRAMLLDPTGSPGPLDLIWWLMGFWTWQMVGLTFVEEIRLEQVTPSFLSLSRKLWCKFIYFEQELKRKHNAWELTKRLNNWNWLDYDLWGFFFWLSVFYGFIKERMINKYNFLLLLIFYHLFSKYR